MFVITIEERHPWLRIEHGADVIYISATPDGRHRAKLLLSGPKSFIYDLQDAGNVEQFDWPQPPEAFRRAERAKGNE